MHARASFYFLQRLFFYDELTTILARSEDSAYIMQGSFHLVRKGFSWGHFQRGFRTNLKIPDHMHEYVWALLWWVQVQVVVTTLACSGRQCGHMHRQLHSFESEAHPASSQNAFHFLRCSSWEILVASTRRKEIARVALAGERCRFFQ